MKLRLLLGNGVTVLCVFTSGKLVAYDTDGDGDFDVEDAKVLLGKCFNPSCADQRVCVCVRTSVCVFVHRDASVWVSFARPIVASALPSSFRAVASPRRGCMLHAVHQDREQSLQELQSYQSHQSSQSSPLEPAAHRESRKEALRGRQGAAAWRSHVSSSSQARLSVLVTSCLVSCVAALVLALVSSALRFPRRPQLESAETHRKRLSSHLELGPPSGSL